MSLPYVILTVLSNRDATGYDITKEFSQSIGYFWKASHQQVYRELNKMASNDLVVCRVEEQTTRPDRKVYSITDLGRQTLFEWFQKPANNPTVRDEFSAKLLVCSLHDSAPMQQQLESLIDESYSLLNHYEALEKLYYAQHKNMSRQSRLERMTLRRAMHNRQAWIYWAEEVLVELKDMDSQESDEPAKVRLSV